MAEKFPQILLDCYENQKINPFLILIDIGLNLKMQSSNLTARLKQNWKIKISKIVSAAD